MNLSDSYTSMEHIGFEDIRKGTRRIAFSSTELEAAIIHVKNNRKKGLRTGIHPFMSTNVSEIIKDGF